MAWTGKIIGGVLGSFLGPWGAAIGVGLGHQLDKGVSRVQSAQMVIQVAFFGCLAKMAQADGKITPEEIEAVEQILTRLGYTPPMREAAITIFRQAKIGHEEWGGFSRWWARRPTPNELIPIDLL